MKASDHYRAAALQELSSLRDQLDSAAGRWQRNGVFAKQSDHAHAALSYADQMLGKVNDLLMPGADERTG